jgi:hypothetical protein
MYSEKLLALFERRGVKPPIIPDGFLAQLPVHDVDHEPGHEANQSGKPENLAFWIKYHASDDKISERDILIKSVKHATRGLIVMAFCYKRENIRTFRADRILEMYWIDTGEIVEKPLTFLESLCLQPNIWIKRYFDGLMLLAFLSRCDGHMHKAEVDVMADYIEWQSLDKVDRPQMIQKLRALYPTSSDVEKAIDNLQHWLPEDRRALGNAIRNLVDADGVVHPAEFDELLKISEHLKVP